LPARRNAEPLDANSHAWHDSDKRRFFVSAFGLNVLVSGQKPDASSFHTLIVLTGAISQAKQFDDAF
jgi:hypothetical protein